MEASSVSMGPVGTTFASLFPSKAMDALKPAFRTRTFAHVLLGERAHASLLGERAHAGAKRAHNEAIVALCLHSFCPHARQICARW